MNVIGAFYRATTRELIHIVWLEVGKKLRLEGNFPCKNLDLPNVTYPEVVESAERLVLDLGDPVLPQLSNKDKDCKLLNTALFECSNKEQSSD